MNSPRWLSIAGGVLGFVGMGLYVPWLKVERVYEVVPTVRPDNSIVSMGRTDKLLGVQTESVGYGWVWSPPSATPWFGTEIVDVRINWRRLAIQAATWGILVALAPVCFRAARPDRGPPSGS